MKTTIDIPDEALRDAIRFAGAKTKRDAVLACIEEFNRQHRMAELVKLLGTFGKDFPSHEQMEEGETEEGARRWKR
jgi:hypothetical protein